MKKALANVCNEKPHIVCFVCSKVVQEGNRNKTVKVLCSKCRDKHNIGNDDF